MTDQITRMKETNMTLKDLQAQAKTLNIVGRSKMSKDQLILAIAAATTDNLCNEPEATILTDKPAATSEPINDNDIKLVYATMTKGEARKLRKEFHAKGERRLAALKAA